MDVPGRRTRVKICGVTTPHDAQLVAASAADYVGIILFPPSPRAVRLDQVPRIAKVLPPDIQRVALTVDADDALIDEIVGAGFDWLQLHGSETPERVREVANRTGLKVMKAIGVREAGDLAVLADYVDVVDQFLIDAKPPKGAAVPGGHGIAFDWSLIAGLSWAVPWMLAGGLTPGNVAEAVRLTGAAQVDVASGTESAPGIKDPKKVRAFIEAAKSQSV